MIKYKVLLGVGIFCALAAVLNLFEPNLGFVMGDSGSEALGYNFYVIATYILAPVLLVFSIRGIKRLNKEKYPNEINHIK